MLNQITKMRLPDGREVAFVDWQDTPLYSTADLLGGWTDDEVNLFTYIVGDRVPGTGNATVTRTATEHDTNVQVAGSMASTEEMLVYSIRPEFNQFHTPDATPTDLTTAAITGAGAILGMPIVTVMTLATLQQRCNLELIVSQKVEHGSSLAYYNTGFGATSNWNAQDVGAETRAYASAGVPGAQAVRTMSVPVHIGGQEKYRVALKNPRGAAVTVFLDDAAAADTQGVVRLRVYLDGLYKRPVS